MIFYKLLTNILYPFIYFYLLYRKYRNKENDISVAQKLGLSDIPKPQGLLIWIHTVSVGEYLSVKILIQKLQKKYNANILVTTTTLSSAKIIKTDHSLIHQYLPIDNIYVIKKFLKHWQPDIALWIDSEMWPNILGSTSKICPIILINGKLSDKSYTRWLCFKKTFSNILRNFTMILPQTIEYYQRFESFTVNNIKYIGNIKYSAVNILIDRLIINNITALFPQNKLILIAASTHEGEELFIANAYRRLKEQFSNIFLIIAPRHPNRKKQILDQLKDFNIAIRSQNEMITNDTEIYLADTIGELIYFYQISDIAFIGGSLSAIGGHNPLEAANSDCALIYGPCYSGFREIVQELINNEAIYIVQNSQNYIDIVTELICNEDLLKQRKINAKRMIQDRSNLIDKYLDEIDLYVKKNI